MTAADAGAAQRTFANTLSRLSPSDSCVVVVLKARNEGKNSGEGVSSDDTHRYEVTHHSLEDCMLIRSSCSLGRPLSAKKERPGFEKNIRGHAATALDWTRGNDEPLGENGVRGVRNVA